MKCRSLIPLLLVGTTICVAAQSRVIYLSPAPNSNNKPPASQSKAMTVDDVIKLSKAGLSDDLIIQQIRKKGQPFDLSADQIVQLKSASVSERVIEVMLNPTSNNVASAGENKATPAAQVALPKTVSPGDQAIDLKALVGKTAIAQRMPFFEPGTFKRLPDSYAGQQVTIIGFKPLPMPKLPLLPTVQGHLSPEQRALMDDARNGGTLIVQFPDGTKADTNNIMPSMLPMYSELSEPLPQRTVTDVATAQSQAHQPAASSPADVLSAAEVKAALNGTGADHWVYIMDAGLFAAQGAQVPSITLYMPEAILASESRSAKKQFISYEPSEEEQRRSITVVAHGYAGETIADGCTSITRIILLSDPSGRLVEEPYLTEPLEEAWQNNMGARNVCEALQAKFTLTALQKVRAAAPKGEFTVAVYSGSHLTKMYTVKTKHQSKLGL